MFKYVLCNERSLEVIHSSDNIMFLKTMQRHQYKNAVILSDEEYEKAKLRLEDCIDDSRHDLLQEAMEEEGRQAMLDAMYDDYKCEVYED